MALYLITGGAGFIGSHLVEALQRAGHGCRVLDDFSTGRRDNLPGDVEIIEADVGEAASVASAMRGVDGCFHLAAIASVQRGHEDWWQTHKVNVGGSVAVFEAARDGAADGKPVPVVYASSAAVYGDNQNLPLGEDARPAPLSAYGVDKLASEWHGRIASEVHGVSTVGFRFFNVYGPRQDPHSPYSGVIAIFADRIARGEPVTVNGDGAQTRDFVYVGDVVRYLTAAMADRGHAEAAIYNICRGREITVLDLAQAIAEVCGGKANVAHGPARPGDIRHSRGDPARLIARYGITPDRELRDGLAETLAQSWDAVA